MFIQPVRDPIVTRGFNYLSNIYVGGQHAADDFIPRNRPATGEPIRVVAGGVVTGVGWDFYSGFFVAVDHAGGWRTFYRHLYGQTPVSIGQRVNQGQIIGNVGNTGYSLGAHLHFDLWCTVKHDATAFAKHGLWAHNPELYLGQEDDMMTQREFNEMFLEAWKAIPGGVPFDKGDGDFVDWATPARIAFSLMSHKENDSLHGTGSGGLTPKQMANALKITPK